MIESIKKNDKIVIDLKMLPFEYSNTKKETLRKEVAKKYGVKLSNVIVNDKQLTMDENGNHVTLSADIIKNIQDPAFQSELMRQYIELNKVTDINFDTIKSIDAQVNAGIDWNDFEKSKSYKVRYLKWDNFLSYGEDNYLDFTKLHGLVLLNGYPENMCGKSTLALELLRFAFYGKSYKVPTLEAAFNDFKPEATEVKVEAGLTIDNEDYVIRRTITRPALARRTPKSKCKQVTEFYKVINDIEEIVESKNGISGTETNQIIKEYIGDPVNYDLVVSADSHSISNLLRLGQADRSKLFSQWLGLVSIEKKEEIAKEMWKKRIQPTLKSNVYNKATLETEVNNFNLIIEDDKKKIGELNAKQVESVNRLNSYNNDKINWLTKKKEVKESLVKTDITTLEAKIKRNNEGIYLNNSKLAQLQKTCEMYKDAVYEQSERNTLSNEVNELNGKIGEYRNEYRNLNNKIADCNKLISEGICIHCGHPIDVQKNQNEIEKIKDEQVKMVDTVNHIKEKIAKLTEQIAVMDENREKVQKRESAKVQMAALKSEISRMTLENENYQREIDEINTNKENIRINNDIDAQIRVIDVNIKTETGIKEGIIREIEYYNNDIATSTSEIGKRANIIQILTDEEEVIKHWEFYKLLVGRNGIVKIVLKQALPIINNELSRLLGGLVDFEIELALDDENNVVMLMHRNGVTLNLCLAASGYEGTMAGLALRQALSSISSLAVPNYTVLDELIGTIGNENFDSFHEMFNRMAATKDFIIDITHDESTYEWHDCNIVVSKDKATNVSRVTIK